MRIAFYSPQTSHLKPVLHRGGDPIFLQNLFAELRRHGHEIEVISHLNVRQLWKGDVPARSLLAEAIAVRRRVRKFRPDAWLVYEPSAGHPDLFGWWQRPRRYLLLAVSMHQSKRMRRRWRLFLVWCHGRSLRRADSVITYRRRTYDRVLRHGISPERLRVLPPAASLGTPHVSQDEARRRLGLPLDVPILLCVTRFTELGSGQQKTEIVLRLLDSLTHVPEDAVVVIVGDGPGRAHIEERAAQTRPHGRVQMFPAVPHEELIWFYAACDLYAYPDLVDLPRISVLEAQACGRPVLTMRTASSELTVSDGRTGVLARDLVEFGEQLAELVTDRSRREAMGQAAREYVAARHSMEVRARQLMVLLESR
jgi:glycosyltransferase involved in cell wall biosynthesis